MNQHRTQNTTCIPARLDAARIGQQLKNALHLRFDMATGRFSIQAPGQAGLTILNDDQLLALLANTVATQPDLLPGATFSRLKKIITALKQLTADAAAGSVAVLEQFVTTRIEPKPGSVTVGELHDAYLNYCRAIGSVPLPRCRFERRVSGLILASYSVLKSHSLKRAKADGTISCRYGYHNLTLRNSASNTGGEVGEVREQREQEAHLPFSDQSNSQQP